MARSECAIPGQYKLILEKFTVVGVELIYSIEKFVVCCEPLNRDEEEWAVHVYCL